MYTKYGEYFSDISIYMAFQVFDTYTRYALMHCIIYHTIYDKKNIELYNIFIQHIVIGIKMGLYYIFILIHA